MYIQPDIQERVQLLFDSEQQDMAGTLGISFTSFKKDEVKATMPVDERTIQPFGVLHGGASVALAETLASIGAWLNIDQEGKTAVGIEINANHIRPVKKGSTVKAIAQPVQRGRRIQVWKINIFTPDDKLVCVSRCTLAIVGQ